MLSVLRRVSWLWPVLIITVMLAVVMVRVWSGWATRPMAASAGEAEGILEADRADLAAWGVRIRRLQDRIDQTRHGLMALRTEAATKRDQVRVLDTMLETGRLTRCPDFLRGETTVRALQKIIAEAAGTSQASGERSARLHTAAAVARERLRAKLAARRRTVADEVKRLEQQADALRHRLGLQMADLARLQQQVEYRLDEPDGPRG